MDFCFLHRISVRCREQFSRRCDNSLHAEQHQISGARGTSPTNSYAPGISAAASRRRQLCGRDIRLRHRFSTDFKYLDHHHEHPWGSELLRTKSLCRGGELYGIELCFKQPGQYWRSHRADRHRPFADRNFKRPSGPRLPTILLRVTSLMLRPSLGAAWLAWAIRAAGAPLRRAPGH